MLKFCSMGVHLGSRDLLKFWKISGGGSATISETVQDRHIVTMESLYEITCVLSMVDDLE